MESAKFDDMCSALFAGGWNSRDAKLMAETYAISREEADRICARIGELYEGTEEEE